MKILITGHKGFVGSHFRRRLHPGHDLTLIDIKPTPGLLGSPGKDAGEFFRENNDRFDLVIHLAATVGGRKTIDLEPHRLFNNFVLDSELIQWALRTKPKKIVYYSSSAAYPMRLQDKEFFNEWNGKWEANTLKLKESDIDLNNIENPDPSVYGLSKLTGEHLINYVRNELDIWTFRPFSGYSEQQSLDYPFPSFIARGLRRDDPFEIWGDGEQVRDWIHIDDIVSFTLKAIEISDPDVFNICTGRPTSFNEFATILTETIGYNPKFKHLMDAPVGVQYRVGDPEKQNKIYIPKITLEEGIRRALID
jgi:nucleoside-diphosphate-sugar epimerase